MEIFKSIDSIKKAYENDFITRQNGTLLLGVKNNIPKCEHMIFKPLSQEIIDEYLISQYLNQFPSEYIKFLKKTNGANFFNVRLKTSKFQFAYSMFTVFGLPRTPPFGRKLDMEEPFDLRVEDLSRHDKIPKSWLKCGSYIKEYDFDTDYDIFIDTSTDKIYSCKRKQKEIIDSWSTLDECFCDIFNSLKGSRLEYQVED